MVQLCLHPLLELVHHRFALFLVKNQPVQGAEFPFLDLGLEAVNLPQTFDEVAGGLGKALLQVDEISTRVQQAITNQGLKVLGLIAGKRITHLERLGQVSRSILE